MPLVSELSGSNGLQVLGPAMFYDTKSGKVFNPAGAERYSQLYDSKKYAVNGYVLYNNSGKVAFMSPVGKVLSDYIYYATYGHEGIVSWRVRNGFAVHADSDSDKLQKYGVLDLRTGNEVIQTIYDEIELYEDFAVALKGNTCLILSYTGKVLADLGGTRLSPQDYRNILVDPIDEQSQFYSLKGEDDNLYIAEKNYDRPIEFVDDVLYYDNLAAQVLGEEYSAWDYTVNWLIAAINYQGAGIDNGYPPGDSLDDDTIDIYNSNLGEPVLLMSGVLGYVWDLNDPFRVVVYKDSNTCGFCTKTDALRKFS